MKNKFKLLIGLTASFLATSSYALVLDTPFGKQEVPDQVNRIVVLDLATADNLIALGKTDKVVGIAQSQIFPSYVSNNFRSVKNVGGLGNPDFEAIAELKPDLIVLSIRGFKHEEKLREIAPVLKSDIDYADAYGSVRKNILNTGKIVNNEAKAKALVADLDKKVAKVAKQAKGKTALVLLANDRKISAFGPESRFGIVYQAFGFKAVDNTIKEGRHGSEVSFEYLKSKNPDYVFVVDRTAAISEDKTNFSKTFDNALVKETKAYKTNKITPVDPQLWYLSFGGAIGTSIALDEMQSALDAKPKK